MTCEACSPTLACTPPDPESSLRWRQLRAGGLRQVHRL